MKINKTDDSDYRMNKDYQEALRELDIEFSGNKVLPYVFAIGSNIPYHKYIEDLGHYKNIEEKNQLMCMIK
jgi:hypothetical protein